ncbi:MAG: CoA pyrophosphatase [Anaerolineales bacterium]|nr:CoA pyrophosphatase [Anaerolineales bacterium]
MHNLSEDTIRQRLAARAADPYISPYRELHGQTEPRPAAVLIPLLRQNDEWHLLYILRAQVQGDMHSGQVAFPGGRLDPDETQPEQAALREAQEEVGLEPSGVRLLGHMEEFITISNYQVTPVVGVIPWPFELQLQGSEVQRAFTIPLDWLADPANREERQRIAPDGHTLNVVYFTEYDRELLWGLTARITLNFLDALGL